MKTKLYWRRLFTDPTFTKYVIRDWIVHVRRRLPQRFHHLGPKRPCTCYDCYL